MEVSLNEKFRAFARNELPEVKSVDATEFEALGHRNKGKVAKGRYCFETGSTLESNIILAPGNNISVFVGAHSYINGGGYMRDDVLVGRYCSIGRRVTIAAGGHDMAGLSTSPLLRGSAASPYTDAERAEVRTGTAPDRPTIIEPDVWIGDGAVIRPGITLATGTVVGANAVVIKDTEPYEIVGGVPAKSLGHRFSPRRRDALIESEWWEYDLATLRTLPTANIFEFIVELAAQRPPRAYFATYLWQ